jgi:hypothetical protein
MKTSTIIHIILCLIVLTLFTGCSHRYNQVSIFWKERQMDDDRRLYGNPYDSLNRQKCIFSFIPLMESSFIILFQEPWQENLHIKSTPLDSAATIQDDVIIESQSFLNSMIFSFASSSVRSSAMAMK